MSILPPVYLVYLSIIYLPTYYLSLSTSICTYLSKSLSLSLLTYLSFIYPGRSIMRNSSHDYGGWGVPHSDAWNWRLRGAGDVSPGSGWERMRSSAHRRDWFSLPLSLFCPDPQLIEWGPPTLGWPSALLSSQFKCSSSWEQSSPNPPQTPQYNV